MDSLIIYKSPNNNKFRLGRDNDGGYIICDLPGGYDSFISCGISNDISFEQAFLDKYPNILCVAFDGTIQSLPENDNRIIFIQKNVGEVENDSLTNLHKYFEPFENIFLKMDIEGHEFRVLPTLSESQFKKIKQLVLEVHTPGDIRLHPDYFKGLADITDEYMLNLLTKIKDTHTLIHVHPNNGCKTYYLNNTLMPNVFECTFIRNDYCQRIQSFDAIPSPIDMKNIPDKPELILQGYPWN